MIAKPCRVSVWCVHSYLHPERQSLPLKRGLLGPEGWRRHCDVSVIIIGRGFGVGWGGVAGSQAAFPPAQSIPSRVTMAVFTFRLAKGWVIHRNASLSPMLAFCWGSARAEAMLNNGDCQIIWAGIITALSVPLLLNVSHAAFTDRTSLFDINDDWAADGQNRGQTDSEFEQRERFKGKSVRKHKQCRNMMDDVADA